MYDSEGLVVGLWRDSSRRLTFDLPSVSAEEYPAVCRRVADAFGLAPAGDIVIRPEQMFWDVRRGEQAVGLDWDIWMEFMAVAKSATSEPLVTDIAAWLDARPEAGPVTATAPPASPSDTR
ncbi:hypothetical protein R5W23_001838 [Gemmata sp. JC673]|uniref:Uncharacterized protein n=1 Tax=Gemmata algarum TaxID=2975278 RepID=A0ABU5F395_9BACT|nr:hypothetical protein [Gemmata algarum]MDY3560593.1 hypothetical protein [Gemmata algarum]